MTETLAAVVLGADPLTVDDVVEIAEGARVTIGPAARSRMTVARRLVEHALAEGAPVYGLTRRLGSGAEDAAPADQAAFQRQILANHQGAVGAALPADVVRAAMAARLAGLALGGAGVRPETAEAMAALLNAGVDPVVPDRGSVGAADLAQLAAVGTVITGGGRAFTSDGAITSGADALADAGLPPLQLAAGEALALINTNAFSVGLSALLTGSLEETAEMADVAVSLALQAAAAHRGAGAVGPFDPLPNDERHGYGQALSAGAVRTFVAGGALGAAPPRGLHDEVSFRAAPLVHGAVHDSADRLGDAVDVELAARAENPLVDPVSGTITPNGNFTSIALALELESARLALAHLAQTSERRIAVLSALLRPFRAMGTTALPGLTAYSAADHVATLRQLAAPVTLGASALSEIEDYAPLTWPAARLAAQAADLAQEVLAIEALHAADLLRVAAGPVTLGEGSRAPAAALVDLLGRGLPADDLVQAAIGVLSAA